MTTDTLETKCIAHEGDVEFIHFTVKDRNGNIHELVTTHVSSTMFGDAISTVELNTNDNH
jgi:hypothetical protein